jgi:hypothetical protein
MEKIPSEVHGVIDYVTAGTLVALPRIMGWRGAVRGLMTGAGMATMAYSLLTRYELGLIKLIPFKMHLAMDAMNGVMMAAAPLVMRDEEPEVIATMIGIGAMELAITAMSDPEPFRDDWANHLMGRVQQDAQDRIEQTRHTAQNTMQQVRERVRR